MSDARQRHNWDQTCVIWAVIANTVRDPKKRPEPFQPKDVHPFMQKARKVEAGFRVAKGLVDEFRRNQGR